MSGRWKRPALGWCILSAMIGTAPALGAGPATAQLVAIDKDDIGGVVAQPTRARGRGMGDRRDERTARPSSRKMVVTDDQGRFVIPDLPSADYQVWVRGYGLVDLPKVARRARQGPQSHRRTGARRRIGRALLPCDLLVFDDADPGGRPIRRRQRDSQEPDAGRLPQADEEHRLRRLSPARPGGDAHPARARFRPAPAARTTVDCGGSSPARPATTWSTRWRPTAWCHSSIWRNGATASPTVSCRPPSRIGRRALSATSS